LALLCAVAFLALAAVSVVNIALPSIRRDLHMPVQNLQWILSGYLLTFGGFMLLGGRSADLFGRRRLLLAGTALFAVSSFVAGLAQSPGALIGARLAQGLGGAMMLPAALSILTTTFEDGTDRRKALGAWGGGGRACFGWSAPRRPARSGTWLALGLFRIPAHLRARPRRDHLADRR